MWTTTLATRLGAAALVSVIGLGVGGTGVVAAAASSGNGDNVSMRIMVDPSVAASGATFTDTFMVMNVGDDKANDVRIDVPFDSSAIQLLGVQFNDPSAWVTSATADQFHADLGGIGSHGQSVQVVASFAKLAGYQASSTLPIAITYHYSDNGTGHGGTIDTQLLPVQAAVVAQPTSMVVAAGGTLPINSAIFSPNEPVTFWYNTADGQALPLYIRDGQVTIEQQHKQRQSDGTSREQGNGVTINADAQGAIAAMLSTKGLAPGAYTLVAHGLSSSATAVVAFQLQ